MLAVRLTAKTIDGPSRVKPAERSRTVAQTASSRPETSRINQDMRSLLAPSCRTAGYGAPRPGAAGAALAPGSQPRSVGANPPASIAFPRLRQDSTEANDAPDIA